MAAFNLSFRPATAAAACLAWAVGCAQAGAAPAGDPAEAAARAAWRQAIARVAVPEEGCFAASYPQTTWRKVACQTAPTQPYVPRHGQRGSKAGNGNDYAAVVAGLISSATGSFPAVSGVTSEIGSDDKANTYSLQLNSGFFTTSACDAASDPASCQGWQQFVYSNSGVAFMQYWLLNYGNTCPSSDWMSYQGSCYRNSDAVSVPTQPIANLAFLKVSGKAIAGGIDTMVMTTETSAYSTTGQDSVVNLAGAWSAAEFNVVGDGSGSVADFNTRDVSVTVQISLKDGGTAAPVCQGNDGTTGETNNLTPRRCTVKGGATPHVKFTENNY